MKKLNEAKVVRKTLNNVISTIGLFMRRGFAHIARSELTWLTHARLEIFWQESPSSCLSQRDFNSTL